jgi:hypothetical protein
MADTIRTNEFRLDSYSSMGDYQLKIECNTVTLAVHNGPSNLTAAGHCQNQYNYQTGYGKIDCSQLQSAFVFLTNNGSNDSYVNAKKLLEAKLGHTGNVYYTGQPDSIRSSISGSGRLISF